VKKIAILMIIMVFALGLAGCMGQKEEEELVMGFVPMKDAESLIESVGPLAEMLSQELGIKVRPFTAVNYVAVIEGLGSGQVDFGFIPPFSYVLANSESNARVVLTALRSDGKPYYKSQFLARHDRGIDSLEDLHGKKIAFVDQASTSGYLFPAAHLIGLGYDIDKDFEMVFAGGHDRALQALINGDVDAAVMFVDARVRYVADFPTAMDVTKVIGYTEEIPNISVTVRGSMDTEMSDKITAALLKIAQDPQGAAMLKELFNMHGFVLAQDSDYDVVRHTARALGVDLRGE
jgi:phosphonate transport system substrate-binding protein